ncbi:MAG: BTAD domain-containing putative transcriptional regulator [Syntrophobacteraceae bacterium]
MKPQMLLKALISRGGENVVVDLLIEDLWPDASPERGKRNFRVVLHRLRKFLGHPAGPACPYLSCEMNTVSLNRSAVSLDIDEFLCLCKSAGRAEQTGDLKSAVDFGNSAIELYKGDYLEDELYTLWTMIKREEIRARYVDILLHTAVRYEHQGNSRKSIELYKLLIKADPVFEESYRKLMLLYSNLGRRAEVVRVYEKCRRVLDREVGVEPDMLTTSIYRRIVENSRSDAKTKALEINHPGSCTPEDLADKILTTRCSMDGERKIVTIMFASVADSSTVFENLDPEAVHEIMDGCFRLLLEEVHRFEGTINQFLLSGVMALFGAPVAHEYLYYGKFIREEAIGLVGKRVPGRAETVKKLFESVGGTVESYYLGAGEYDYVIIANVPGNANAASASLKMCACGFGRNNMCALLAPEEIDAKDTAMRHLSPGEALSKLGPRPHMPAMAKAA